MNMKRLVATALAAAMIFGLVSVGFAASATLPDLDGHEFEDEIRTLAGLGVITGYTDGEFKADNPLTRAEFTALIVRMLGVESMAAGMQGETVPFSDVDGSHWASGNILIAEALGIVNGYPDGSFKPEASVNHAEAVKMVLTAMGYVEEGFPVVRWPVTWMVKANEIGLDEDVELLGTLPITRGDVAKVLHNSLEKAHVRVSDGEFTDKEVSKGGGDVTFLGKLGLEGTEGVVVDSPELWNNDTGKIELAAGKGEFKVDNYEGLLGHQVRVWHKNKDVYYVEDLSSEKEFTAKKYKDDVYKKLDEKEEEAFVGFVNYLPKVDVSDLTGHEDITVIYDKDDNPIAVRALKYSVGVVDEVALEGDKVKNIYFQGAIEETGVDVLDLTKADVEYVGVDDIEDIEEGDVVHFIASYKNSKDEAAGKAKRALVIVVKDVYEGVVTEIVSDVEWKVGGKVFEVDKDLLDKNIDDYLGEKVRLYLDKEGKVYKVDGDLVDEELLDVGVVQKTVRKFIKRGEYEYVATILTEDGEFERTYKAAGDEPIVKGSVVAIAQSDDEDVEVKLSVLNSVYNEVDKDGNVKGPWKFKVAGVNKDGIWFSDEGIEDEDVTGMLGTVESPLDPDDILWLRGDVGEYTVRSKPVRGASVELYYKDTEVVVGIVK